MSIERIGSTRSGPGGRAASLHQGRPRSRAPVTVEGVVRADADRMIRPTARAPSRTHDGAWHPNSFGDLDLYKSYLVASAVALQKRNFIALVAKAPFKFGQELARESRAFSTSG